MNKTIFIPLLILSSGLFGCENMQTFDDSEQLADQTLSAVNCDGHSLGFVADGKECGLEGWRDYMKTCRFENTNHFQGDVENGHVCSPLGWTSIAKQCEFEGEYYSLGTIKNGNQCTASGFTNMLPTCFKADIEFTYLDEWDGEVCNVAGEFEQIGCKNDMTIHSIGTHYGAEACTSSGWVDMCYDQYNAQYHPPGKILEIYSVEYLCVRSIECGSRIENCRYESNWVTF